VSTPEPVTRAREWLCRLAHDSDRCRRLFEAVGRARHAMGPGGSSEAEREALDELVDVIDEEEEQT